MAYLTRTGSFVAGVVISASHNPYRDNGLKVFGHNGFKLPDSEEHLIEQEIFGLLAAGVTPAPLALSVEEDLARQYLDFLLGISSLRLDGVKIVIDCGNGAAYRLAPELFRSAGRRGGCHLLRARRPQHQSQLRRAPPGRLAGRPWWRTARPSARPSTAMPTAPSSFRPPARW